MSLKKYMCYFFISLGINYALFQALKLAYSDRKTITVVPATGILEVVKKSSKNKEEEKETVFSYRENPPKRKEDGEVQKYRPLEEPEKNTPPENKTQQMKHAREKDNPNLKLPFSGDKAEQSKRYPSREQYMEFIKTETKLFKDKRFLKTVALSVQFPDSLDDIEKLADYFNFKIVGYSPNNLQFLIVGDKQLRFKKIEAESEIADFYRSNTNRTIENMPSSFLEQAKQKIERDIPDVNSEELHLCFLLDANSASYFSYKQDLAMKHIGITEQDTISRMSASFAHVQGEGYYILKIEDITLKNGVIYHIQEDPELSRLKTL